MLNNKNVVFMKDKNNKLNINDNILKNNIINNNIYNNILFESVDIDRFNTNYNTSFNNTSYINCCPNFNDIQSNILSKNKDPKNTLLYFSIVDAYFIYSITNCSHLLTHNVFDIFPQINFFNYRAKQNPDISFIIEIISKNKYGKNINYSNNNEYYNHINNIKKIIQYFRDLDFKNPIIILSNKLFIQFYINKHESLINIKKWKGKLFVKNLHVLYLSNNNNCNYLPLLSRYVPNLEYNEVFNTTLYKFLKTKYKNNSKKNFILEKRIREVNKQKRGFLNSDYNLIKNFCENHCKLNDLNLIIWDYNYNNKSILEQQQICYNSDIIISIGGSFNLFNIGHSCSKIIILEVWPEYQHDIVKNINFNIFADHCSNGSELYLYMANLNGRNKPIETNYYPIINNIFNNNIKDYIIKF